MTRVHIQVFGRVQGVFYRASTQARARSLGLTGWVRNRGDGSVAAIAEGEQAQVDLLVQFCTRGPPQARVDRIETNFEAATGEFDSFSVLV